MKMILSQSITLDRETIYQILSTHFKAKGYDVANIDYVYERGIFEKMILNLFDEDINHE